MHFIYTHKRFIKYNIQISDDAPKLAETATRIGILNWDTHILSKWAMKDTADVTGCKFIGLQIAIYLQRESY
jgi:hypothetical protein